MTVYAVGKPHYKEQPEVRQEHGVFATREAAEAKRARLIREEVDDWNAMAERIRTRVQPVLDLLETDLPAKTRALIKDKFRMDIQDATDRKVPDFIAKGWVVVPLEVIE